MLELDKHSKRWTDDEEKQLLELYRAGESVARIASKLHRTPKAVALRICHPSFGRHKNHAVRKAWTWDDESEAVLLDLANECNLDFNKIGKKLGRTAKSCMNRYLALQEKG